VLGKEVNVAARLMTMAKPGQILVTGRVKEEAGDYDFWELGPAVLKGLSQPLPVFALLGRRRKQQAEEKLKGRLIAPMVGREAERALITGALQSLRHDHASRCILIEGEAGIGKSRLALDLIEQAQRMAIDTLLGTADAIDKSTPYYAWRPVVRQLFKLDVSDEELIANARRIWREHVLTRLEQFDPVLLRLAPLLNAVLPLDFPENELTSQLIGSVRADNTHELLAGLIKAATSAGPLLLVLEDAHWLDSASWAVVRLVTRDVQTGMLFVVATRPFSEPIPAEYTHLLQATHTQRIQLETLSSDAIDSLICQRLGITRLPPAVAQFIHDKVEGHPFFSEELAYALRDADLIRVIDGECRVAPGVRDLHALDFPDTIQGVITGRIDRLSPERQLALKVASVIGRIFAFRTLRDVHPVEADRQHLRTYLDALQRLDITPLETPEPDLTYIFKHIITRDVAYNLMTFSQRRRLHRVVAEWYEHTHADDLATYYSYLAYHWRQAVSDQELESTVATKAIDFLEKAGEQALQSYANQEATGFLGETLALDDRIKTAPPLRRARWERQMGEAYLGLGKFGESRAHLEQALALLGQSVPGSRGSFTASLLGQTVHQMVHRVRKSHVARRAPNESMLSEKDAMRLEAARVFTTLGNLYYFANEANLLLYAVMRSINLVEGIGPSPEAAQAYSNLCVISGLIQLHALAETYSRLAQAASESVGQLPTQVFVLLRINLYRTGVGRWQEAEDGLRQAMEISDRLGDRTNWIGAAAVLFVGYSLQGKFTRNVELAIAVRKSARRIGNAAFEVWGLNTQAYCELLLGRSDEALGLNQATQALLPEVENTDRVAKMDAYGLLVKLHLHHGDMGSVKQHIETLAMLVAQSSPTAHAVFNAYDSFAEAALALWEANRQEPKSEFESSATRACKSLQAYARVFPVGKPRALLRQGLYDWLAGKPAKAAKHWQTALAKAEKLEMPYDQALAHYTIGRYLAEDDPARQEHLKRASALFAELGAVYDQARVEALVERNTVLQAQ
jgi:tetratricopeptide (TPR) repeat protein